MRGRMRVIYNSHILDSFVFAVLCYVAYVIQTWLQEGMLTSRIEAGSARLN